jgi:tetratricopeptide (TPR) repeat protein
MSAPRAIALCHCFTGTLEFQAGNWDVAEAELRESISMYREIGAASGEALACHQLAGLQAARGELDAGLATLQAGEAAAERAIMRAHCLTRIYAAVAKNRLAAGDLSAAVSALESGLAMSERHGNCTTCDSLLLPAAVSVRLAQGDLAGAEAFCDQLQTGAEQYSSHIWIAKARLSRAELAAACDDLDEAINLYVAAHEAFMAVGHLYEAARSLQGLAHAYQKRQAADDKAQAQAASEQAQQLFGRLGLN